MPGGWLLMDAIGSSGRYQILASAEWNDNLRSGLGRSANHAAEPHAAGRHPHQLVPPVPDQVGLGGAVVGLQRSDGLAQVPVRQLELERHALADVIGRHEVLLWLRHPL